MERKKASALVSLWMILLASFALVAPIPPASATAPGTYRYLVMGIGGPASPGNVVIIDSLDEAPMEQGYWNFTIPSMSLSQNITFSEPWNLAGYGQIVNLTVPAASYTGISHMLYDKTTTLWIKFSISMSEDGKGWIFLNATGDVECHTFSNNTGVYWRSPSPKAPEKAADTGELPSPGPDGVAGTADDGFGDGNATDPRGSSILMLKAYMTAEWHGGEGVGWQTLFTMNWPQVFTTGNASSIVIEPPPVYPGPGSQIHGANQSVVGQPWEYYAGLDSPGDKVEWAHQNSTAYVTYACAWSMLDIQTTVGEKTGKYDLCFSIREKKVREDCVIADINCDEVVNIKDIVTCALAFGAKEANFGPDGIPYTGDDQITRDTNFDGRGDLMSPSARGNINIKDIVRIAIDFGAKLTPEGIIRP